MKIVPGRLAGIYVVDIEPNGDERGFFARTFCYEEFARAGLVDRFVQESIAYNNKRGTLRGLHYARAPHAETKLVRCVKGAAFDVVVDIRPESPSYGDFESVELDATTRRALYVPPGFAHGYQTLEDDTELFYAIAPAYVAEAAAGVRFDDPSLGIPWPVQDAIVSDRDRRYPTLAVACESR